MSQPFLGEIKMFGGNFAPRGYAFCQGQILAISQYDALFSLLGTIYGGNGQTTFGLPDLRSRVAVGQGQGPGLSNRAIGEIAGSEQVTLTANQMPAHTHAARCLAGTGNSTTPADNYWAANANAAMPQFAATPSNFMNAGGISLVGGNQPHDNLAPYLAINFIIALEGIYPSRN